MIDVMYDLPDRDNLDAVYVVTAEAIEKGLDLDQLLQPKKVKKESA
jgi:hypothetical protein